MHSTEASLSTAEAETHKVASSYCVRLANDTKRYDSDRDLIQTFMSTNENGSPAIDLIANNAISVRDEPFCIGEKEFLYSLFGLV
jgi:hypothetical protein